MGFKFIDCSLFITLSEFKFSKCIQCPEIFCLAWQIALQLVRQGETIDAALETGPNTKENPVLIESSDSEHMDEDSKDVDELQTNPPADESTDSEVV